MQTIEQRPWSLSSLACAQRFAVVVIIALFSFGFATQSAAASSKRGVAPAKRALASASRPTCAPCEKGKKYGQNSARLAKTVPCHPKGYIDPKIAKSYQKAMRDLHHAGIKPQVTSVWRSSQEQAALHR